MNDSSCGRKNDQAEVEASQMQKTKTMTLFEMVRRPQINTRVQLGENNNKQTTFEISIGRGGCPKMEVKFYEKEEQKNLFQKNLKPKIIQ